MLCTLIDSTWMKPEIDEEGTITRLLGLTKIVSNDLVEFNLTLWSLAHDSMLLISDDVRCWDDQVCVIKRILI